MSKRQSLIIQMDSEELTEGQKRLIKYLNTMIYHTLTTDDEGDYFDSATEAMRMLAGLIKKSNFIQSKKDQNSQIPYEEQVLEFSIETLNEDLYDSKKFIFDN